MDGVGSDSDSPNSPGAANIMELMADETPKKHKKRKKDKSTKKDPNPEKFIAHFVKGYLKECEENYNIPRELFREICKKATQKLLVQFQEKNEIKASTSGETYRIGAFLNERRKPKAMELVNKYIERFMQK